MNNTSTDPFLFQAAAMAAFSSVDHQTSSPNPRPTSNLGPKKRRNLPGTPDPDAEVIALSPKSLMSTNRFICEICNKGFQRDQNLQLHRRGHNLPWKLKQRAKDVVKKKVYICPEKTCVHHNPSRALGDLTGIKKHFSRKHGEKKWKCDKCSKKYAVHSDLKAHLKICGTREYKCDCGTLFSRKDSFITHRAFCDALAEESARFTSVTAASLNFRKADSPASNAQSGLLNGFGVSQPAGITQLRSILRPDTDVMGTVGGNDSLMNDAFQDDHPQKSRFSVWLNQQANAQLTDAGQILPNSSLFGSAGATGFSEMLQMGMANNPFSYAGSSANFSDFTHQFSSPNGAMSAANLSLSPLSKAEAGDNKANSMETATAALDCQNTHPHPRPAMSATALLQKAAQIGSTRSNPSSIFGDTLGVMSSSLNTSTTQGLNFLTSQTQENINGGGQQPRPSIGNRNQHGDLTSNPNPVDHGSFTRDFLGVGAESGHRFSPHDLASLASMRSAMGLGQFAGNG
ncbi:hypothetical protein SAY87_024043 [Trapa incisa]|uniref:C2H2-type domain-containing protein n=1 Tax=Trapa incisa TaxID=236973 RepID=A0AAN7KYU2_9MYRT|nr:hypothetical protein SAY87_024043 [Trapa incisa]